MGRIVVGVDGSKQSHKAFKWAVEEAALRGATVEAVYAYEYTPAWKAYAYSEDTTPLNEAEVRVARQHEERAWEEAEARARSLVEHTLADVGHPPHVTVEPVVVEDRRPARALVNRSRDADMLVVGSRGRGGFAGLVLGSVSQQSAHHASCPVVIISDRDAAGVEQSDLADPG